LKGGERGVGGKKRKKIETRSRHEMMDHRWVRGKEKIK